MKKFSAVVLALLAFALLSLAGCSDKEAEAEIQRLEAKNAALEQSVDSLKNVLEKQNAKNETAKKTLQDLDMGF